MFALLASLALADDRFFLDAGPEQASLADLEARGAVHGRTGALVVALDDPHALDGDPRIARVERRRGRVVRVVPAAGVDDLALARDLHGRPGVAWVNPDLKLRLRPASIPNDPLYPDEWHLDDTEQGGRTNGIDINAPEAWETATGAGVTIAVIDSGVQLDHPDLVVTPGHDYIDDDDDPTPGTDSSSPHGTGVAGIAAARGNNGIGVAGVAWEADIYAIRLIGGDSSTSDLYDSFAEAVDAGADVLSNSWGFYGCEGVPSMATFQEMFNYAEKHGPGGLGSVVVFAAGNDDCDNSDDAMLDNRYAFVVAALEWNDVRASYSNYGENIDISAPTSVLTTDMSPGGYGSYGGDDAYSDGFSGTSGATPVVSGVVALMIEANPRITAKQIRTAICESAVRNDLELAEYDKYGWSPYYGYGRIDAAAAVNLVADTAPAAPVLTAATEAYPDRVFLSWEAAIDPDGDVTEYVVHWWLDGEDGGASDGHVTSDLRYDLTGKVAAGDVVHWTVVADDPWGAGETSVEGTLTVLEVPEAPADTGEAPTPSTCATAEGSAAAGLLAVAALLGRRRRRA